MTAVSGLSARARWGAALIAGGLCLLAMLAATPFVWRHVMQSQLDEGRQLLTLIESRLDAAGKGRKATVLAAADAALAYVPGATAGLATANLQKLLVDLATASGQRVERVQPLPAEEKNGLAQLRLEIATTGNVESLRSYLLAIETGTPLLFIREAHLSTPTAVSGDTGQLPSDNLAVSLQVEAYGWWGAAP